MPSSIYQTETAVYRLNSMISLEYPIISDTQLLQEIGCLHEGYLHRRTMQKFADVQAQGLFCYPVPYTLSNAFPATPASAGYADLAEEARRRGLSIPSAPPNPFTYTYSPNFQTADHPERIVWLASLQLRFGKLYEVYLATLGEEPGLRVTIQQQSRDTYVELLWDGEVVAGQVSQEEKLSDEEYWVTWAHTTLTEQGYSVKLSYKAQLIAKVAQPMW